MAAYERGATILRVHDVGPHVEALAVARGRGGCAGMSDVTIELRGLALQGFHGAHRGGAPRRPDLPLRRRARRDPAGAETDALEDTIDYREVVALVREISDGRAFVLLEALAAAVADAILERFAVSRVRVRVRKPDVRLDAPVEHAAVTVERPS